MHRRVIESRGMVALSRTGIRVAIGVFFLLRFFFLLGLLRLGPLLTIALYVSDISIPTRVLAPTTTKPEQRDSYRDQTNVTNYLHNQSLAQQLTAVIIQRGVRCSSWLK